MCHRRLILAAALGLLAACSQRSASSRGATAPSAARECRILTVADIKAVTGADVHLVARGSSAGARGTCGIYATADGDLYLGVNAIHSVSEYTASVSAVAHDIYSNEQPLAGVGDEGVLFKDKTMKLRYLVARKGNTGVVIFPLVGAISDEQLRQLAARALGAR